MIVVVLKNPPERTGLNLNVELRMMIEDMSPDEADNLGQAIHEFAVRMHRRETMSAFQVENDSVNN